MMVNNKKTHETEAMLTPRAHLVNFEGDDYHVRTAKSLKEDEELLKAGFEYVTDRDEVRIYRKRK